MSAAEIADNRWEYEATKVETMTVAGIAQLVLVSVFALFFAGVVVVAVYSIFAGPQESQLVERFNKQSAEAAAGTVVPTPAAVPAVAPAGQAAPALVPVP